jgi:PucR C-terminal helix-turn-helix domain/GAF domain/GGDEF-like domain
LLRCPKALSTKGAQVRVEAEERRVHALMQVGRAMASTADYEQALAALIRTISELLNVESAGFMLYDPERSELVLQQPAFGFDDPERIAAYHVPLRDGGNAVKVFLSGRPYLTNDAAGDPRLIRRFVDLFDARTSLTVPLIVEDQAIGVCHAINKRGSPFTDEDLELLNLIAPLLAVSVQSAHLFRQVRAQERQLERAIFLQRELSRTAFDAPGMGPLVERLADLVNRPVMVLDPALRPLATSRWPEELQPDEHWLDHGQREVWWRRGQDRNGRPVLAPIAVGSHFGGYLAVWDGAAPLDEIDARAIEHAATIFALEMLHERASYELELRLKGDLLRDLSSGEDRDDRDVNRMLADLGYTIAGPWRFAQVHASWRRSASPLSVRWRDEVQVPQARLYPAVRGICLQVVGAAAVVPWRSGFLMLLPAAPDNLARDLDVAADLLDRVHAAAEHVGPGARVHLAVSSPVRTVRELGHGLHEAEQAVELARRLDIADRPLAFEHLGVYRILLDGGGSQHRHDFVEDALGPLSRYDAEHDTALVTTLRAYVEADYNANETARRLYVHANTLAYRLRTIRRLLGGDPARGDLRLTVELALKLKDLPRLSTASGADGPASTASRS